VRRCRPLIRASFSPFLHRYFLIARSSVVIRSLTDPIQRAIALPSSEYPLRPTNRMCSRSSFEFPSRSAPRGRRRQGEGAIGPILLDPDPSAAVVFIAGGIGITPLLSMLRWCAIEQPERSVYLYYGVRDATEHAFREALEELTRTCRQLHVCTVYSRASSGEVQGRNYDYTGHVDVDLLRRTLPHGRHQFYVCGPAAMMDSLIPALSTWGVPAQDIHYEAFGPALFRSPLSAQEVSRKYESVTWEVHLRRSGRTLVWDGQDTNLLQFAERHGVPVESGCRAGSCGSCETALDSGTVRYAHEPDHRVASGHCLLCIGTPGSALVLEA
jgi:ferredoxin-NADP reductase